MSLQDVCDLLWEVRSFNPRISDLSPSCSYSLANCIVDTAYERGSWDNVAVVVVPLVSSGVSENLLKKNSNQRGDYDHAALGIKRSKYEGSGNKLSHGINQLEYPHPVIAKFGRLMVEGKYGCVGCFYLSENLDEQVEHVLETVDDHENYVYGLPQARPKALDKHYGCQSSCFDPEELALQGDIWCSNGGPWTASRMAHQALLPKA